MPQGLQCFDEDGNVILDVTNRITKYIGQQYTGVVAGSISVSTMGLDIWISADVDEDLAGPSEQLSQAVRAPTIVASSNSIAWDWDASIAQADRTSVTFSYGVY